MNNETNLEKFAEVFFKNLKCNVFWKENILVVENVPTDFEKIYGKKSPYCLVFQKEQAIGENEFITKGSSLLKVMADYLSSRAQTSLLKLNFNPDFPQEISKRINFNGSELTGISQKSRIEMIFRFTFLTNFQYLNEREQMISTIYVKDNEIIDFNLDNYDGSEGKKEDLGKIPDVKEKYNIAKEKLKLLINDRTEKISKYLDQSLEIEVRRIKSHYLHHIDEISKEIQKNNENLILFEKKLLKAKENEKKAIEERIERIKVSIQNLKTDGEIEKLEKEESFFIQDEKQKHSLNISNSLINTTIVYYPIFLLKFGLKKKDIFSRNIENSYDPIKNLMEDFSCDSCKNKINDIFICSSGHLSCKSCIGTCSLCGKEKCPSCNNLTCTVCGRDICDKCKTKCSKCMNYTCSSDIGKDALTNRPICTNCSKFCSVCGKFSDKLMFSKCSSCGREICFKCSKRDARTRKNVCANCYKSGF